MNTSWLCPLYMLHKLYCIEEVDKINRYTKDIQFINMKNKNVLVD